MPTSASISGQRCWHGCRIRNPTFTRRSSKPILKARNDTPATERPSGKRITVFFYDGPISQAIAFEKLLERGENLASRLTSAFSEGHRPWPQLVHIATDGETYGHHHKRGEMALAYALHHIETNNL